MESYQCVQSPQQHLRLSLNMRKALHVLQLPVLELSEWLMQEIEQNPVLEIDSTYNPLQESLEQLTALEENSSDLSDDVVLQEEQKRKAYQISLLTYPISLYEHLHQQARCAFQDPLDLNLAEQLIGSLDSHGFLQEESPEMSRVIEILQSFDPPGICARNLRESLLIQLKRKGLEHSRGYQIVAHFFDELLSCQIPKIAKYLKVPAVEVQSAILDQIAPLHFHLRTLFAQGRSPVIIPDIYLEWEEEQWSIRINHDPLPRVKIVSLCQSESLNREERQYIREQIRAGQWLQTTLGRRQDILTSIALYFVQKQGDFLKGENKMLFPMTLKDIAQELSLHESTIARAISGKYLHCPQGVLALRSLLSQGISAAQGQHISNQTVQQMLTHLIDQEDKTQPLSDEELAKRLNEMGIFCARRTVAKYRTKMQIASASYRKRFLSS